MNTLSDDQTTAPVDAPLLLRASDYPAQAVEWLWPGKIPIGKVSLIIGDPGLGKSLLALDIAARLSRGDTWPEEGRGGDKESGRQGVNNSDTTISPTPHLPLSPSSSIILSANDDLADTIRPRLDAAGADPRRIYVLNSITDLRTDFTKLRAAIDSAPDCRLIIIDPINAYVGSGDSQFHSVVRKVLAPLAELAAEKRIAVVAIAHLRKTEGAAIYRAAGSMGFVASARAIWTVSRDPEDSSRQLLLPLKNNLAAATSGLAYSITSQPDAGAPGITWHASPINKSSEHGLRRPEAADLHAVRIWLRKALGAGPRSASDIKDEAQQFDFGERTLRRALHAIGGTTQNRGFFDGWWWSLESGSDASTVGQTFLSANQLQRSGNNAASSVASQSAVVGPQKTVPLCPLPRISPSAAPTTTGFIPRDATSNAQLAAAIRMELRRVAGAEPSMPQAERSGASSSLPPTDPLVKRVAGQSFQQLTMSPPTSKIVGLRQRPAVSRDAKRSV